MRRIRLIHTEPIEALANAVNLHRDRVYRVWLVSPWIGGKDHATKDSLQLIITALQHNPRCRLTVVTREPKDAYHLEAVQSLRRSLKPVVYYCSSLHTKLYIVEAEEFRSAIIGSPNLTVAGNRVNLELALELRATAESREDDVAMAIAGLVDYSRKLLLDDAVTLS